MVFLWIIFQAVLCFHDCVTEGMNTHVSYFEHLNYDTHDLRRQHERSRRSVSETTSVEPVEFEFKSHGRYFHIHLVPDKTVFHEDLVIEGPDGEVLDPSLAHVYHGTLYGKKGSYVHGSILDGVFRGVIEHPRRGKYYVEESKHFFGKTEGQASSRDHMGRSVMYHESAVRFPKGYKSLKHCGSANNGILERMARFQNSSYQQHEKSTARSRRKRQLDDTKTTCLLLVQSDYVLFEEFGSTEAIISRIAGHVKAANQIYLSTAFKTAADVPIRNINFKIQRMKVNGTETKDDPTNPYKDRNLGVEKFLDIASMENHDLYCLAYVFTNRDFDNGVLGLAWVGSSTGSSGGICDKYKVFSDRIGKSLNSGIVTFKNFGSMMPVAVSHVTLAHELGHSFGSPHDSGLECTPGERLSFNNDGNYIMYARATTGNDPNNLLLSPCSIRNISAVLEVKKDLCFVASDQPICGNQIVDKGEECDCGFEDTCTELKDTCCVPADVKFGDQRCKLKPKASCSITQGSCCNLDCSRKLDTFECSPDTDCQFAQTCNSSMPTAACPDPAVVPDGSKECNFGTQTCAAGECTGSICLSHPSLEPCECTVPVGSKSRVLLCHTCCQLKGLPNTCGSTESDTFSSSFKRKAIFKQPGSACDDYNGYCDIFSNCRLVDADGPLSRLKNAIFNPELYSNIRKWILEFWYAVVLIVLGSVLLMAGFIQFCSLRTPSSNPELPKPKDIPVIEAIRRHSLRRHSLSHSGSPAGLTQSHRQYQPQDDN